MSNHKQLLTDAATLVESLRPLSDKQAAQLRSLLDRAGMASVAVPRSRVSLSPYRLALLAKGLRTLADEL